MIPKNAVSAQAFYSKVQINTQILLKCELIQLWSVEKSVIKRNDVPSAISSGFFMLRFSAAEAGRQEKHKCT